MELFFHARNSLYKSPQGPAKAGEPILFQLDIPHNSDLCDPRLVICPADSWDTPTILPMALSQVLPTVNRFAVTFTPAEPALLFYHFTASCRGQELLWCSNADGFATISEQRRWQLTVYDPDFSAAQFIKGGLFYQIFPDRFFRSGTSKENVPGDRILHPAFSGMPHYKPDETGEILNNDYFGGDLEGILQKLPYLSELGVTCIYLNPIFEAHSNHRYNTADYKKIDPLLGTEADFIRLCQEAHKMDIRVILDGVFSHTGSDSIYFNREGRYGEGGAYRDKNSPYHSWFQFKNGSREYECWWGIKTLPNLIEENPDFLDFICGDDGVLEYWLSRGADGFRLDVADELPDVFLDAVRRRLKRHGDKLLIGEVWEDASNKIAYGKRRRYLLGEQLDSVMDYPMGNGILDFIRSGNGHSLHRVVDTILENYPPEAVSALMNSLSTHDVPRAITLLGSKPFHGQDRDWQAAHHQPEEEEYLLGRRRLCLASLLQYTLPGVPCLYYGDEAGLYGYRDPFNRCPYPWGDEDTLLLEWFTQLGQLRKTYRDVFASGDYLPVQHTADLFSFLRTDGKEGLFVAVNRGETAQKILLPAGKTALLLGEMDGDTLPPLSCVVLKVTLS